MRVAILDDEQPALDILSQFVNKLPDLELRACSSDPFEILKSIQQGQVDLLLLDIEMPDINGLDFLKSITTPPLTIFTSAYTEYALDGYELDVVDYLLKPISFQRFLKGINKAQNLFGSGLSTADHQGFITVHSEYQQVKIDLDEILYIEGLKDYVKIYCSNERIVTRMNLKKIMEELPEGQFLRVHRSYIVAKNKVSSFTKSQLSVGDKVVPIGSSYRENVSGYFNPPHM